MRKEEGKIRNDFIKIVFCYYDPIQKYITIETWNFHQIFVLEFITDMVIKKDL